MLRKWYFLWALCTSILLLYLVSNASLFHENLTHVGGLAQYRPLYLLWVFLQSAFYLIACLSIYKKSKLLHIRNCMTMTFTCCLAIVSMSLPYTMHANDLYSQIHVIGGMSACIFTICFLLIYAQKIRKYDIVLFQKILSICSIILFAFSMSIYAFGDISSLGECILCIGLNAVFVSVLNNLK